YYHFDQSGSTVALTNDAGVVTDRVEYTPYGTVSHREGATDTPFLYAGQFGIQQDPNGLLHMRARFYSPELKRFINADPAGFDGGMNWYAYANNSPLMYVDPDGEAAIFAMLVSGAINVAIGYALSGGDYDVRDAAIDFAVGAAFGGLAGRGLSSTRTAGKLYSYSKQASFRGNVFNAKRAGRAWATRHAPGAWAFEGGIKNTAIRAFRTGSLKPFKSYTQFSGPANQAFRPVSAVGPLRGWKRIGGQHFTSRAGNLNLSTGAIARPSIRQSIMYYGDAAIYHSVDAIATGTAMQGASSFIRNQFSTSGGGGWK
ncbi:MAG: RHS repeat-associated core domain-containing protein, partial [Verrucomicrobia bacterium]|nr:RHS repeat-associated core domain-containing protein [Verrucomicrobiota bacterium]